MSLTTASDAINMALEKDKADNVSRLCFPDKERQRQRLREKYFNILIYPLLAGNENLWKMPSSKAVKKSSGTCTVSRTGNCTVSRTGNCTVSSTKTQESSVKSSASLFRPSSSVEYKLKQTTTLSIKCKK
ncbi:Hypothetical predicted protein [Octopus vulgaris]|uniref:Uncharacterized protein n=1 Tax=Octopus vulgaris TaxID=6645 RepID=A0AA36FJI5_OCTVU|nr:Hypothetical predicted protein [Octopus vulgaris]